MIRLPRSFLCSAAMLIDGIATPDNSPQLVEGWFRSVVAMQMSTIGSEVWQRISQPSDKAGPATTALSNQGGGEILQLSVM